MADFINLIVKNIGGICTAVCVLILLASMITSLTPTPKDNEFVKKIIEFADKFSIAQTQENQKYIDDAKKNVEKEPLKKTDEKEEKK